MLLISEKTEETYSKTYCLKVIKIMVAIFKTPWKIVFSNSIYYEKFPFFSFLCILAYCTLLSRYLIYSVELLVNYLPFSHIFVGLTFASWGGNISGKQAFSKKHKNIK